MVASAWAGVHEADIVALILDAKRGIDRETTSVLDKLVEIRRPKILVVNKIDAVDDAKARAEKVVRALRWTRPLKRASLACWPCFVSWRCLHRLCS